MSVQFPLNILMLSGGVAAQLGGFEESVKHLIPCLGLGGNKELASCTGEYA